MKQGPLGIPHTSKNFKKGDALTAKWVRWGTDSIKRLGGKDDPGLLPLVRANYDYPFRPTIGGDDLNRLFVAPGHVCYSRLGHSRRPILPTLDGAPLSADPPPSFDLTDMEGGSLWLVCQNGTCGSSDSDSDDPERIELTDRGDDPPLAAHERAVLLCEFDLEEIGEEGSGQFRFTNFDLRWASDWIQENDCTSDYDSSSDSDSTPVDSSSDSTPDSSDSVPDSSSSGSDSGGSTPSGSSDSDSSSGSSGPDECCPDDITVSVTRIAPGCIPVSAPGPLGHSMLVEIVVDVVNPYKCPDCHNILFAAGVAAGQPLIARGIPSDGLVEPWLVEVRPVIGCAWFTGQIRIYGSVKPDADPADGCVPLLCTRDFFFRAPPYCGDECSGSSSSSSSSSSAP